FAARGRSSSAMRSDPGQLCGCQLRKQALRTRDGHRKRRLSCHGIGRVHGQQRETVLLAFQQIHTAVVDGTSTTCSATNHTCNSLRRMTSLTSRSFWVICVPPV